MTPIGKVLRAQTPAYVFGCKVPRQDVPIFGALVSARIQYREATVFGLIHNIQILDDGMTRMLSVADDVRDEDIAFQRARRVPVEASVLCVGYQDLGQPIRYALPAQPPVTLDPVYVCDDLTLISVTENPAWLRLILDNREVPGDELIAAAIRQARDARREGDAQTNFVMRCGRELARLLTADATRLDSILRRIS
jgi:hypothetical protein